MIKTKKIIIKGIVQGVGFRSFAHFYALRYNISGYVKNLPDGSVEVVAKGEEKNLKDFIETVTQGPTGALISEIKNEEINENLINFNDFRIER